MGKHAGRLELTWTDKDKALLSTGDGKYDYTFVEPSDYRVSEVRLLHETERVEAPDGRPEGSDHADPTTDNLLITGDAMHVLDALAKTPEFADRYLGKVKLVYIDPPFNTGQAFAHFEDNIEHSIWLTMLRDRLRQIKPLLAEDGSVWVHLDHVESHRCRVVLDEEFGAENFVAEVAWQKAVTPRNNALISTAHDTIFVYRRSAKWSRNRLTGLTASHARNKSRDGDPVAWRDNPVDAPGAGSHQGMVYAIQHPITGNLMYTKVGRCWGREQSWFLDNMSEYAPYELREIDDSKRRAAICGTTPDKVRQGVRALMLAVPLVDAAQAAQARYELGCWPAIYLTGKGRGGIQIKAHERLDGRVPDGLWLAKDVGANIESAAEIAALFPKGGFSTPKPERLLQRIIHIATQPGDVVLDCFAGSGTTAAVAHKMGRRWVTSELVSATAGAFTKPRLTKVVRGEDPGGVSTTTERAAAPGTELADGLTPLDAKHFQQALGKVLAEDSDRDGDGLNVDLGRLLAKQVRTQAKDNTGLSAEETKTLLAMLKKLTSFPAIGVLDVTKSVKSELNRRTKTRDVTTTLWHGGGGFTHLHVGPSMFEEVGGMVLLAEWATQGDLARAMCAQLEVPYRPDGIFAATRGRVRYLIVDGIVGASTIDSVLDQLTEGQTVEVWATQVGDDALEVLRKARPGSRLGAIPDSVIDSYRRKAAKESPFKPRTLAAEEA